MVQIPEELIEDLHRLSQLEFEERPPKTCYLLVVDPKGNWSVSPKLYELKKQEGKEVQLQEFEYKAPEAEMRKKHKLGKVILERLDEPIRTGIGKQIKEALLEKPLSALEMMATTKGRVKFERKPGCFFIIDEENNRFFL